MGIGLSEESDGLSNREAFMSEIDSAVRRWRARQERESSLSPHELDELEDHLRVRADLEMELNATWAPERAFAVVTRDLGEPSDLSREFAKAGKPRWRRFLLAGWALFAGSFAFPAYVRDIVPAPFGADGSLVLTGTGWDAFGNALGFGGPLGLLSALTNMIMVASLLVLGANRRRCDRLLRWLVVGACFLNLAYWPIWMVMVEGGRVSHLLVGYWMWVISFLCVGTGLWTLAKERPLGSPSTLPSRLQM